MPHSSAEPSRANSVFFAARSGCPKSQIEVWNEIRPAILARLKQLYDGRFCISAEVDDLLQDCWPAFLKSLRYYRCDRGMKFSTFAWMVIGQAAGKILSHPRYRSQSGFVPETSGAADSGAVPECEPTFRPRRKLGKGGRPGRDRTIRGIVAFVRSEGGTIAPSRLATAYHAFRTAGAAKEFLGALVRGGTGSWVSRRDATGRLKAGYFQVEC